MLDGGTRIPGTAVTAVKPFLDATNRLTQRPRRGSRISSARSATSSQCARITPVDAAAAARRASSRIDRT